MLYSAATISMSTVLGGILIALVLAHLMSRAKLALKEAAEQMLKGRRQ